MLLNSLSPSQQKSVLKDLKHVHFKDNDTIFSKDDPSQNVYLLLKGSVKSVNFSHNGEMAYFKLRQAPDYFGYYGAIGNKPRTSDMIAVGDVECALIPRAQFLDLIFTHRSIGEMVLNTIVDLLRDETERLTAMITLPTRSRIASDILTQSIAENTSTIIVLGQTEWAAKSGMKRETLSRGLNELAKLELITINKNQIEILDSSGLRDIIDGI